MTLENIKKKLFKKLKEIKKLRLLNQKEIKLLKKKIVENGINYMEWQKEYSQKKYSK